MSLTPLYPLRFAPTYQYRLWGGRHLATLLSTPLPDDGPIGEAWLLSDRAGHQSIVANGPLQGRSLGQLMEQFREQLIGRLASRFDHFPLLLKFLDAQQMLSVQVHPGSSHGDATPVGVQAKTEAWVVIEAEENSRIYAGLKASTTAGDLRLSLCDGTIANLLTCISPKSGDAVFIPAGTVHTLGDGVVVFEVQQNSDTTYRLYDWGHIDPATGKERSLQVEQAFACIDFGASESGLIVPDVEATAPVKRENLFDCQAFRLWRLAGQERFPVGAEDEPRVLVCLEGSGQIEHLGTSYAVGRGEVWLLPAEASVCQFQPSGAVTLLEIAIP